MLTIIFVTFTLIGTSTFASESVELPPVVLGQGEQRLIKIPGLTRYSLGSDIARVHLLKHLENDELLMKGLKPGMSDLWVWKSDGGTEHRQIRIEKIPSEELKPSLLKALSALNETEIIYSGAGVVLRGEIHHLSESSKISAITRAFSKEVHDETELSEMLLKTGAARLSQWLKTSAYSQRLRLEQIDRFLWVRGHLERPSEFATVEHRIRSLFPAAHLDIETLPDSSPTIHFKVFLLELKKNRFGAFGISWPANQEAAFRVVPAGIQNQLGLDLTLQTLEGEGSIRILSKPELAVRAPGEAELFSGGELPIHLQKHFFSNVTWKPYGLSLKLKVTHSAGDRVRLDIFTEVSHLDSTIAQDHVPGIQSNRMKTQVDARYGIPLFLSGLLQSGMREQARGLPILKDLPILGALFGSEDYLNERSELVAVLLPNASPPSVPLHNFQKQFPRGLVPLPRNWIAPQQEKLMKESKDYPWNALQ